MRIHTLTSPVMSVSISDFGARIVNWNVNVNGQDRPIVLGYANTPQYAQDPYYLGAVAGPYANRIEQGHVSIKGEQAIRLTQNDGRHHLHGGNEAFDQQVWTVASADAEHITFQLVKADGWNGYPGPCDYSVTYRLQHNQLHLVMRVNAQKITIAGPTGHSYFNLNGVDSNFSGLAQWLHTNATHHQLLNAESLPSGDKYTIENLGLAAGRCVYLADIEGAESLDANVVFSGESQVSTLWSKAKDLSLTVTSTYPAAQLYSGKYLDKPFTVNQGVCIEPHFGAISEASGPHFNAIVTPGHEQTNAITYTISTETFAP
ncbi:aldose epimerase family protein [Alteromonas oceanisediminis]|uniref:aldose epimerase family protein n=1 Tax=Alteromonas oceanisediminis TaxID=2836180 RepID=UPI001BD9CC99|nr:aldose epimerase [Alteromonas oceanisediminis]MBT0584916.1 aldose epimerase [Alteromonas oceanisediminis]